MRNWLPEEIIQAYQTKGIEAIVKESGDTTYYVCKVLKEAGVKMRPFHGAQKKRSLNSLSRTRAAYLAGILDGEGTILIHHRKKGGTLVSISIANTNRLLIDWLLQIGGNVGHLKPGALGTKICYSWKLSRIADVKSLLEILIPYLLVKQRKAKEALKEINNVYRKNGSIS